MKIRNMVTLNYFVHPPSCLDYWICSLLASSFLGTFLCLLTLQSGNFFLQLKSGLKVRIGWIHTMTAWARQEESSPCSLWGGTEVSRAILAFLMTLSSLWVWSGIFSSKDQNLLKDRVLCFIFCNRCHGEIHIFF